MMDALKATRERSPQLFAEAVQWLSSDCLMKPGSSCSVWAKQHEYLCQGREVACATSHEESRLMESAQRQVCMCPGPDEGGCHAPDGAVHCNCKAGAGDAQEGGLLRRCSLPAPY